MRRISLIAALAAVGVLALAGTASADIGDIDTFTINDDPEGTATTAEVSGTISCTTTIEYGLVGKVAQDEDDDPAVPDGGDGRATNNDEPVEGVGAFGPNQGNDPNSPCSTNIQSWEIVIQNNRDSGPYEDGGMGQLRVRRHLGEQRRPRPGPVHRRPGVRLQRRDLHPHRSVGSG